MPVLDPAILLEGFLLDRSVKTEWRIVFNANLFTVSRGQRE